MEETLGKDHQVTKNVDRSCRSIIAKTDKHWNFVMMRVREDKKRFAMKISEEMESVKRSLKYVSHIKEVAPHYAAMRDTMTFAVASLEELQARSAAATLVALEAAGLLSKEDLKEIGLTATDYATIIGTDLIIFGGTISKALQLIFERVGGIELEEHLWNSWSEPIRRDRCLRAIGKAELKYKITMDYFVKFYVEMLLDIAADIKKIADS